MMTPLRMKICSALLMLLCPVITRSADSLPNTKPLNSTGDLATHMVAGIHRYLDEALQQQVKINEVFWKKCLKNPGELARYRQQLREQLTQMLGVHDARISPPSLEYFSGPENPAFVATVLGCKIYRVKWQVFERVHARGYLIEPAAEVKSFAVALPHGDQAPEELAGLTGKTVLQKKTKHLTQEKRAHHPGDAYGLALARHGCRVLIPTMINRSHDFSRSDKLARKTNIPHREFIHRMAYEMGRTLTGLEMQLAWAAVDWFESLQPKDPAKRKTVGIIGYGDGAAVALYCSLLDPRISVTCFAGYELHATNVASSPYDRDYWGYCKIFDQQRSPALVAPAQLFSADVAPPYWPGASSDSSVRNVAAPGSLGTDPDPTKPANLTLRMIETSSFRQFVKALTGNVYSEKQIDSLKPGPLALTAPFRRHDEQFSDFVHYLQSLAKEAERRRRDYWKNAEATTPLSWAKSCEPYRDYFHREIIGTLPDPTMPLNPRSRLKYDEPGWTGYEIMIDVYDHVFAYGILLIPKGLQDQEKRPVVVCQHGLEGTPIKCIEREKGPTYFEIARKLVEKGYIVYCPQNPYYGGTTFRQIQRKAHPLKYSLFSFIVRQHERTLDFLETLPQVDKQKIAFYGLSYGGKTAMRVPAIEKRYCLSICSGDFNEWIEKCISVDLDRSYMWTAEYDMYEFNLAYTNNYAEMAALIAPRPFMVERGHEDGVGLDEMVAYEYAKVRYLYNQRLKIPSKTRIEFQPGGHRIFARGTLEFLDQHLRGTKPAK